MGRNNSCAWRLDSWSTDGDDVSSRWYAYEVYEAKWMGAHFAHCTQHMRSRTNEQSTQSRSSSWIRALPLSLSHTLVVAFDFLLAKTDPNFLIPFFVFVFARSTVHSHSCECVFDMRIGIGWRKCKHECLKFICFLAKWRRHAKQKSQQQQKVEPKWNCETKSRVACREKCQDQDCITAARVKRVKWIETRASDRNCQTRTFTIYIPMTNFVGIPCHGSWLRWRKRARAPAPNKKTTLTNFNNNDNLPVRYGCRRHRQQHNDNSVATGSTLTGQKKNTPTHIRESRNVQRLPTNRMSRKQ